MFLCTRFPSSRPNSGATSVIDCRPQRLFRCHDRFSFESRPKRSRLKIKRHSQRVNKRLYAPKAELPAPKTDVKSHFKLWLILLQYSIQIKTDTDAMTGLLWNGHSIINHAFLSPLANMTKLYSLWGAQLWEPSHRQPVISF